MRVLFSVPCSFVRSIQLVTMLLRPVNARPCMFLLDPCTVMPARFRDRAWRLLLPCVHFSPSAQPPERGGLDAWMRDQGATAATEILSWGCIHPFTAAIPRGVSHRPANAADRRTDERWFQTIGGLCPPRVPQIRRTVGRCQGGGNSAAGSKALVQMARPHHARAFSIYCRPTKPPATLTDAPIEWDRHANGRARN